jgi:Heparinase II/III-like protein/Heparinase II/III N-terminus
MMHGRLEKLGRMDVSEIAWRARQGARNAVDRARAAVVAPRWRRADVLGTLSQDERLAPIRDAAAAQRWIEAHAALARLLASEPQRFVIAPSARRDVVGLVRAQFPNAARDAAARADRIVAGEHDLLGYRGLRFPPLPGSEPSCPDWHLDPVHGRTAPIAFWSKVPFLSSEYGDHKIIWELNRHQHWLVLGRAYWLTGERRYRDLVVNELTSWLDANPPLMGMNWASMLELAFRSLSWIWTANFFADEVEDESPWLVDLIVGLDRQLSQIARNLSRYFSPNTHLLGEAIALYVSGRTLPWLAAAARYERIGRSVLLGEIKRQIAGDGGHRERSTHYHRYALDFFLLALTVARITEDPAATAFEDAAARLGFAARLLASDRGFLPHFGDDDGGSTWPLAGRAVDDIRDSLAVASVLTRQPNLRIGPLPEEACWLLAHPSLWPAEGNTDQAREPIGSAALPETGYYVSRSAEGDHLVVDAGPHGYQNAGHAHADALSLTFTVRGLPLLIDPGTGCYTVDPAVRDRLRSSALHNTLTIDAQSQSTPRGPFHWHTAANGVARRWRTNAGFDYFEGTHDGYRRISHRRHILALHGDLLVIADLIAAAPGDTAAHRADVHWHVDPRWAASVSGRRATFRTMGERIELVTPHGLVELFAGDESGLGWHAPIYGRLEPSATVRISHTSSAPFWMATVFGLNAANPVADVETLPVWAEAGVLTHSLALRISRAAGTDYLLLADPADAADVHSRSWRLAEFETDAAMLFGRIGANGRLTRAAIVDGARLRCGGGSRVAVTLPAPAPHLHLDLFGDEARLSGPPRGARVLVGSQMVPVAVERRSMARGRAAGRSH